MPLTNFEIQNFYQSKPKFNGVYSRNSWEASYVKAENVTYFDSFGVEHITKEI